MQSTVFSLVIHDEFSQKRCQVACEVDAIFLKAPY
jgi:hypothetical protein